MYIGLMSGTSADGVDAALVEISGAPPDLRVRQVAFLTQPYDDAARAAVLDLCRPDAPLLALGRVHVLLGHRFAEAALAVLAQADVAPTKVELIGSHGQTVYHAPNGDPPFTLQIGDPAVIVARTGIPTVADFRAADVAAGGQGAPLVPYPDWLMWRHSTRTRALQNTGGIANVTYLPASGGPESVVAFDTGPGNALIDAVAARATGGTWRYDQDGALAAQGQVDERLMAHLLDHPYLRQPPPKSTGRETFGAAFAADLWEQAQMRGLTPADLAATVTAFTAASIADAHRRWLPAPPDEVFLCGGGADNPTLVRMIREHLARAFGKTAPIVRHYDETGYSSAAKEAVAFAILAYETWHGRPGNLPQVTGASRPVILGHITSVPPSHTPTPSCSPTPRLLVPLSPRPLVSSLPCHHLLPLTARIAHDGHLWLAGHDTCEKRPALLTEEPNLATAEIDTFDSLGIVRLINQEDRQVAEVVAAELERVAAAVDGIVAQLERGGRLIYVGTGTSGRLGVLDAAECPPTFNTPPGQVIARIAGGERALLHAVEGAEDDTDAGQDEIVTLNVRSSDAVVGITACGHTPYVLGALLEARRREAFTVGLTCNRPTPLEELCDVTIAPLVGPEVITGSTRLKAGTAQKMVLNMLSTATMICLGKTYGNLMVDVQPTNAKLRLRAQRIAAMACGLSIEEAAALLASCGGKTKTAIVAGLTGTSPDEARRRLARARGRVRVALEQE